MSMPSIPSRPRATESGGGGLVSSRVKTFANAAAAVSSASPSFKAPPALPSKPKHADEAYRQASQNLPSSKQIRQMAQTFEALHQAQSAIDGISNRKSSRSGSCTRLGDPEYLHSTKPLPKPPPPLPKSVTVRPSAASAVRNSSSDFSIKDMKSKFESAAAALSTSDQKLSQPSSISPSSRPSQRARPASEFFHSSPTAAVGGAVDDFNNNATKVKSIRAELESKLTIRAPNSGPPQFPHTTHPATTEIYAAGGEEGSNAVDYHSYGKQAVGQEALYNRDHFPISSSYTDGFSYSNPATYHLADERPVLPTLSPKSKPPPRPPPCSLPSRVPPRSSDFSRQRGAKQSAFGDTSANYGAMTSYPSGHADISRTPSPQEASGTVAYDFLGEQSDELTSKRGDYLILKHDVDDEWFYAYNTRTGRTGIIPKGFVEVKVPLPTIRYANPQSDEDSGVESTTDGPRCYSLHDFVSNVAGDLTFLKGEVIKLIGRVNNEWLEGESHDGRRGIFPVTFVEIIEDLSTMSPGSESYASSPGSKKTDSDIATVLYDFHSENPGDLSLVAGEKVSVKAIVNADWLYGVAVGSNQSGIFPTSFVDRVPPDLPPFDSQ